jgi:hypothetical protein
MLKMGIGWQLQMAARFLEPDRILSFYHYFILSTLIFLCIFVFIFLFCVLKGRALAYRLLYFTLRIPVVHRYFLRGHPRTYPLFLATTRKQASARVTELWGILLGGFWFFDNKCVSDEAYSGPRSSNAACIADGEVQCDQVTRHALGSFVGSSTTERASTSMCKTTPCKLHIH